MVMILEIIFKSSKSSVLEVCLEFRLNKKYTNEIKFIVIRCFSLTTSQPRQQQGGEETDSDIHPMREPMVSTNPPR